MHRFFVDKENIEGQIITIDGDDVNHIDKVLRLRTEDEIQVCNKEGIDYIGRITKIDKKIVQAQIVDSYPSKGEPGIFVTLFQGLPKSTKMDLIIQKSTEMGVSRIVPVVTKRTVVKLETEKDEKKKVERWSKIAEEAAKQSKRGIVPEVTMPMKYKEAIALGKTANLALIPYELEKEQGLKKMLQSVEKPHTIGIFIGPEGGFDEEEVLWAKEQGIAPITLGNRILRTESAGMAVIGNIMYEYE